MCLAYTFADKSCTLKVAWRGAGGKEGGGGRSSEVDVVKLEGLALEFAWILC